MTKFLKRAVLGSAALSVGVIAATFNLPRKKNKPAQPATYVSDKLTAKWKLYTMNELLHWLLMTYTRSQSAVTTYQCSRDLTSAQEYMDMMQAMLDDAKQKNWQQSHWVAVDEIKADFEKKRGGA